MGDAFAVRALGIDGALELTPRVFGDDRGSWVTTFEQRTLIEATGHPLPLVQAAVSTSRRGVVRGVHFTRTPPGMVKYVCCVRGRVHDFAVDLRIGSPTFGRFDDVELDGRHPRAAYLPMGVGHVFEALEDDTTMVYLMSGGYVPEQELAVSPVDPALGLPLGREPVLSDRDRAAPTLAVAERLGLLPTLDECRAAEKAL
jgi:epimerase EvaD